MAQKKGFGIDVGQNTVKFVELRQDRSGVSLHASRAVKTGVTSKMSKEDRDAAMAGAVAKAMKGVSFGQDPVCVATPGLSAFIRYVKLPHVSPSRLKQIISYEAQQQVPFPLNEVVWDYQVFKAGSEKETSIVLVAIKRDVLTAYLRSISAHGILPAIIEHRPLAVYNAIKFNEESGDNEITVIIDVGERTTDISVEKEGELCWTRSARTGSLDVTEALRKALNVDFEEAERIKEEGVRILLTDEDEKSADPRTLELWGIAKKPLSAIVSEIQRSVNYFQTQLGGTRADKIILAGGCTRMDNFDKWITAVIAGPEVVLMNPLKKIACPEGFADKAGGGSQLNVAVGLALRALGEGFSTINLLPESVQSRQELKKKRAYLLLSGVSMVLMLAIAAIFSSAQYGLLEQKLSVLSIELQEYQEISKQITDERTRGRRVEEKLVTVRDIVAESSKWQDILLEISRVVPGEVVLSEVGLVARRAEAREEQPDVRRGLRAAPAARRAAPAERERVLEIKGVSGSFGAMENLIAMAENSPAFSNVRVISAAAGERDAAGRERINFVVQAEVKIVSP